MGKGVIILRKDFHWPGSSALWWRRGCGSERVALPSLHTQGPAELEEQHRPQTGGLTREGADVVHCEKYFLLIEILGKTNAHNSKYVLIFGFRGMADLIYTNS
jgi:hypothetical protein